MIFVTVGSEMFPFDRLIQAVDKLVRQGVLKNVYCQIGASTYHPKHCRWETFIPFGKMLEHIRRSDVIISHGGVGIALLCLQQGKIPILVPRRRELGEHVDDHQVEFAAHLERLKKAVIVWEMEELEDTLGKQSRLQEDFSLAEESLAEESSLCRELKDLLHSWDRK
jgi:UDP-N-acetylglucosamine transferase subunit ALG13